MEIIKPLLLVYAVSLTTMAIVILGAWLKVGRTQRVSGPEIRPLAPSGGNPERRSAA